MNFARFDEDYIRRLRQGDPSTETHFSAYFAELLLVKLRSRVHSPQVLAEVRQETFLRVLQAVRSDAVEQPDRLGAFVSSVCNNVLLEYLRTESRWGFDGGGGQEPADERAQIDRELISRERKRQVESVLQELSKKDQAVLRMIFLEERDKAEVCRQLGVDPDYLRVVLHRAKARFREKFEENEAESGKTVKRS